MGDSSTQDGDSAPTDCGPEAGDLPEGFELDGLREMLEGPGSMVGPYKLLQEIGEGGMGVVYMAEQLEPVRRRVALKVIKMGMDTRHVIARFEAERQALAMMDHPNIAKALDAGATESGRPYFVMELVQGIPITHYCDQNKLGTKQRIDLFISVCRAVQHAHQKGVIHRDIKPSNVMITLHDGIPVPKVIDFGIAKATSQQLTEKTLFTNYGQMIGTPTYVSPEQAEMSGLDIDTRSDIYSLGVLLYELLTGRTPLSMDEVRTAGAAGLPQLIREKHAQKPSTVFGTMGAELTAVASSRSADPGKLGKLIRGDLDWIVLKCLEVDRTRRYETASALALDLERALNNEAVSARAPTAFYKLQKFARRKRGLFVGGLTVAAALIIGTGVSTWQAIVATRAKEDAVQAERTAIEAKDRESLALENLQESHAKSRREEGKAWLGGARLMLEQKRFLSARLMAGRAIGFEGLGRAGGKPPTAEGYPLLLDRKSDEWAQAERIVSGEFDYPMLWSCRRNLDFGIQGHDTLVRSVAFSPEGTLLASAGFDDTVRLWDAAEGKQIGDPLAGHEGTVWAVAFSPDGSLLASAGKGEFIHFWDPNTGRQLDPITVVNPNGVIYALAFHPDGSKLAWAGQDRRVHICDVPSRQPAPGSPLRGHTEFVYDLCYAPAGDRIASVALDRTLRLWDPADGSCTIRQHQEQLRAVAFHPDGTFLATAGDAGEVLFWTVPDLTKTETLSGHALGVTSLSFSPDGSLLASAGKDGTTRVWQVETATLRATLEGHRDIVEDVAFGPDGAVLASGGKDNTVRLWHVDRSNAILVRSGRWQAAPENVAPIRAHGDLGIVQNARRGVGAIDYASDGAVFAASIGSNRAGVYDGKTGEKLHEFAHASDVMSLGLNPGGSRLAVGCADDAVYVWDLVESRPLATLTGHDGPVTAVAFVGSGATLASGSIDKTVILWDARSWAPRHRLNAPRDSVLSMDITASGDLLAAGLNGGSIFIWRLDPAEPEAAPENIEVLEDAHSEVDSVAFDPAGSYLASAGDDDGSHAVKLWSAAGWARETTFTHSQKIRCLHFASKGKILAAGDDDRQIRLWDLERRDENPVAVLEGHSERVVGLSYDAHGDRLASCSTDGTVRTWSLDRGTWNSSDYLLAALAKRDLDGGWTDYAKVPTATAGARHYLDLAAESHQRFWRFCQAKNWTAAQLQLENLAGDARNAGRSFLAEALAADARRLIELDPPLLALAQRRLDKAREVASESPQVAAVMAALWIEKDNGAEALPELHQALQWAATPAGAPTQFDVAWQLYRQLVRLGQANQARQVLEGILVRGNGIPAGMTTGDLLAPLIDHQVARAQDPGIEDEAAERLLAAAAAVEILERTQRGAPLDLRNIGALRELEKRYDRSQRVKALVKMDDVWRYFAEGRAPEDGWSGLGGFDASGWPEGPALLGFGTVGAARTRIPRNERGWDFDSESWKAFYFRYEFDYQPEGEARAEDTRIVLEIIRDDGLVVYLNGEKIAADNMPDGDVSYATEAPEGVSSEPEERHEFEVPATLLNSGRNVFAAEVHQSKPSSSDLYFGMQASLKSVTAETYFTKLDDGALENALADARKLLPASIAAQWSRLGAAEFRAALAKDAAGTR